MIKTSPNAGSITGHTASVTALAVDPHGQWLASGAGDNVRLWDAQTGTCQQVLEGHSAPVSALAVDPLCEWLASGSSDNTVRLWDMHTGKCQQVLEGHSAPIRALVTDPRGQWIASATGFHNLSGASDNTIRFWDIRDLNNIHTTHMIEILPKGNWVVWHDPDGPDRRWTSYSEDAWCWLGWHAPLPDSDQWMMYPMEAFKPHNLPTS